MMHLLLSLLLAHLFADFPLQTDALARYKHQHLMGVLLHVLIYMGVTALLIADWMSYWPLVIGLGGAHFVIDACKPRLCRRVNESLAFAVDQCLHLVSIVLFTAIAHWWWLPAPTGLLPQEWLIYTLVAAMIPAIIVAYWVWGKSSGAKYLRRYQLLNHLYRRALVIEQRFGLGVVCLTAWLLVHCHS